MRIERFEVTCKECGSKDVDLIGYSSQNYGYGILECNDCKNEEETDGM